MTKNIETAIAREEWDFSLIPTEHVDNAFFYEFSRQSPIIQDVVNEFRKLAPILSKMPSNYGALIFDESDWKEFDNSGDEPKGEEFKPCLMKEIDGKIVEFPLKGLNEADKERLRTNSQNFKNNSFIEIIYQLSFCASFPEVPYSCLSESERVEIPTNVEGLLYLASRQYGGGGHLWNGIEDKTFWEIGDIPGMLQEHCDLHLLCIDWRKTDAELAQDLKEWVKRIRPNVDIKSTPLYSRGLYNQPIPMPPNCKKKDKALEYLGILRKRMSAGTWKQYMHTYCSLDADQREEEKKVAAANKILSWFESQV